MKIFPLIAAAALSVMTLGSCENSSDVGSSLIENSVEIVIDSTYTVTGHSVENEAVMSRTIMQLLGRLDAREYGSIKSDIVTQFISAESIDTTGITAADIDSVRLVLGMAKSGFTGDSLVPMGLEVYRLNRQLPSPIYSDFDPKEYYDQSQKLASKIYVASAMSLPKSSEYQDNNYTYINVDLPVSLGREIYEKYLSSPETFASPRNFTKWFPGLYIRNSFGSGRIINISNTRVRLYYHRTIPREGMQDSIAKYISTYMAVSPEVITNNNIDYRLSADLRARADAGEAILAAPAGLDVEFTFPGRKLVEDYRAKATPLSVVNTLTMSLPAEQIANDYSIAPPGYVLVVKKSEKDKFFLSGALPDQRNSFLASYNRSTGRYEIPSMRLYILDLLQKESIEDEDVEFVITPVLATYQTQQNNYYGTTSQTLTDVAPYVQGPAMAKINFSGTKIKFTYSQQKM